MAAGQTAQPADTPAYPAQQQVYGPPAYPAQPDQPVVPQNPTLQANPAAQQQPVVQHQGVAQQQQPVVQQLPVPFALTAEQQAQLDRALKAWEDGTKNVRSFQCKFQRLEYNPTLPTNKNPNEATRKDAGELRYGSPDRGMYRVDGEQPEKWICDGRSIFEYDFTGKRLIEHKLPPQLWGKAITDGPLPFLFGSTADKLKKRYYLREVTPQERSLDEIWIQALPRYQADAANFSRAELVVRVSDKMPVALRMYSPNKIDNTVYLFEKPVINNMLEFLGGDPFKPTTGWGWTKVIDDVPNQQQPGPQAAVPTPRK
jgi:TIGR03009 family protein